MIDYADQISNDLEFYKQKCKELEEEVARLKEQVNKGRIALKCNKCLGPYGRCDCE